MNTRNEIEEILIGYENEDIFSKLTPFGREQRLDRLEQLIKRHEREAVEGFVEYCWRHDKVDGSAYDEFADEYLKSEKQA